MPRRHRAGIVQQRCRQHRAGADPGRAPGRGQFVGCVGAEAEDVGDQVGRELGQILSEHLPPLGNQLPDHLHHVDRGVEHDQVAQQRVPFDRLSCPAGSFSAITPWLPNRGPGGDHPNRRGTAAAPRSASRARPPGRVGDLVCASSTTIGASASPKTLRIVKSRDAATGCERAGSRGAHR